jgi:hypothetical protein
VSEAAPPVAGEVLTALDSTHAGWRVPGLRYDGSVRFNLALTGTASIEPGTWGLASELPAPPPLGGTIAIVSSLSAPPVNSRFAVYVARTVIREIKVTIVGAASIQALDGTLQPAITVPPGAFLEWVLYHDADLGAVWGLVSDTAGLSKRFAAPWEGEDITFPIAQPSAPTAGDVLTFAGDHAEWAPSSGGGGLVFASGTSPGLGEWVIAANSTNVVLPTPTEEGQRVGCYLSVDTTGVNATAGGVELYLNRTLAGTWQLRPGGWYEWASVDFGEDGLLWVPHGGQGDEGRPPLEDGGSADSNPDLPNQWALVPNAGVANAPQMPINGDCYAVYINGASGSVAVSTGQSIVSPDGSTTVAGPGGLTLVGNTYYEWIWQQSAGTWRPKNYLDSAGNGLTRTGKVLNVVANADASIVVNADDIRVGVLATDAQHGVRGGGTQHALATGSANGFLSSADFTKLGDLSAAWKEPVRVVSIGNVALTGLQTIGAVVLVAGDRVLLTSQTTQADNGIWVVASGAWARSSDANTSAKMIPGFCVYVNEGSANSTGDTVWALTTNAPITLGTTALVFDGAGVGGSPVAIAFNASNNSGSSRKWAREDHSHSFSLPAIATNEFRLSNSSTSSVPIDDAAGGTIYLRPHTGNRIALFSGTVWTPVAVTATISLNFSGQTAGIPTDVFAAYVNSFSLNLEIVAWASASARATAIVQLDGVWVKSGAQTRRYLGTLLPATSGTYAHVSSASGASSPVCGIWNQDNRIRGSFSWTPTFDTWTIPSANTWQSINAQASAKVQYVQGQSIDIVSADHLGATDGTGGGSVGIGIDSTSTPSGFRTFSANTNIESVHTQLQQLIAAGTHNLNAIANGGNTSVRFYGAHSPMLGGISADLWF